MGVSGSKLVLKGGLSRYRWVCLSLVVCRVLGVGLSGWSKLFVVFANLTGSLGWVWA